MKKILLLPLILSIFVSDANAAARAASRGNARSSGNTGASTGAKPVSARAATTAPSGAKVGSASATSGAPKTVNRGRAATAPASTGAKPVVSARAGTVQKVINTGTKVATATKNITVSEECQQKYDGCMDSFCMIENETGGRCTCSDKNAEFDAILAEIEKLDQQSYQMATFGVEKIEMGELANDVIAAAKATAEEYLVKDKQTESTSNENTKKARRTLDLSIWNTPIDMDDQEIDVFADSFTSEVSPIEGKTGDNLHRVAADLCSQRIPECKADLSLLQMMYSQRIKSDCSAYENSLKQQKNASTQKLQTAERALRDAALEQLQNANKYDLGQCTVEFKKCIQTTGGCGDDFSKCAVMSALDNTASKLSSTSKQKTHKIKGAATTIEISAQTYDTIMSKKPLCEPVTKSCVKVADQVWDTFLREVAPQLKSAEIIAEDKARQNCIGNISQCFVNSCAAKFGEDDTGGKYDMCLSEPDALFTTCKIQLDLCGINEDNKNQSNIWSFVKARLASMRVDSCTTQLKSCLTDADRCGEDYTQCIGLDTETIVRMCPYQKLTGCLEKFGSMDENKVYAEVEKLVQGIFLNIDNNFLTECQNTVNNAIINICGSTDDCSGLKIDKNLGNRTLKAQICVKDDNTKCYENIDLIPTELLGEGKDVNAKQFVTNIAGKIPWQYVEYVDGISSEDNGDDLSVIIKPDTDFNHIRMTNSKELDDTEKQAILEIDRLITTTIASMKNDPKVLHCIDGRTVQGVTSKPATGRFEHLTSSATTMIANAILQTVRNDYNKALDTMQTKANEDLAKVAVRITEIKAEEDEIAEQERIDKIKEENRVICLNNIDGDMVEGYSKTYKPNDTNEKNDVHQEEHSVTYDPEKNTCTVIKRRRNCNNIFHNCCRATRYCKDGGWGEWYDSYNETITYPLTSK